MHASYPGRRTHSMGTLPFRDPLRADASPAPPVSCPFHDGPQTLDLLLGELRHASPELVDLALELRHALTGGADAEHLLALVFTLRRRLAGRHHLAFYRVRCWLRRAIVAEVRPDRASPWRSCPLPLDCGRLEELRNRCLATLAENSEHWPPTAAFRVRYAAAPAAAA